MEILTNRFECENCGWDEIKRSFRKDNPVCSGCGSLDMKRLTLNEYQGYSEPVKLEKLDKK